MDRREALKRTAWLMGGVVSAPAIMGVLKGCAAKPSVDWKPAFLSNEQATLITQVSEIIILKTVTPGAKEAGDRQLIEMMVKNVYSKDDQDRYTDSMKASDDKTKETYGDAFVDLDPEQQAEFVKQVDYDAMKTERSENKPENRPI